MSSKVDRIRELTKRLGEFRYRCLFGDEPMAVVYYPGGQAQICLTRDSDYIGLEEARNRLKEVCKILKEMENELINESDDHARPTK